MSEETDSGWGQRRRTIAYYEAVQPLYSALWSRHAVHYGLWEFGTRKHRESLRNLDRCIASHLELPPGARVLDAGCGIGGTGRHLAVEHGLRVVGITLSPSQARRACRLSRALPPPRRPLFLLADYTRSGFAAASFDGIVAVESACHADRKLAFLTEAARLLRPGGRLVVADGFRATDLTLGDDVRYQALCTGMALPSLAGATEFVELVRSAGLVVERNVDLTTEILPSAHRIFTLSRIGVAVCRTLALPRAWLAHGYAGLAQLPLFRERLLEYRLVVAAKPMPQHLQGRASAPRPGGCGG